MKRSASTPLAGMAALLLAVAALMFARALGAPETAPSLAGYVAPPLSVCDPMEWHEPEAMPTIPDPLSNEQYESRVAALHLNGPLDIEAAKSRQTLTVVVMAVKPKGSAEAAGIKAGDVIGAMEGFSVNDWEFGIGMNLSEETTVSVISPGSRVARSLKLAPGPVGVEVQSRWDLAALWARDTARDEKFDPFLQVAAAAFVSDPVLSQAALCRAQQSGCRGATVAAAMCLLSYEQWQFDQMLPFGAIALKTLPFNERGLIAYRQLLGAMATFKLPYGLALNETMQGGQEKHPEVISRIQGFADDWRKLANRVHANPLEELTFFPFRDASARIVSAMGKTEDLWETERAARLLRDDGKYTMQAAGGVYQLHMLGPTGNNADLSIEFTTTPSDKIETPFSRSFTFGLFDARNKGESIVAGILFDTGRMQVACYTFPDYSIMTPPPLDQHHRARIIVVDQRCEIIVNGKRVFYGMIRAPAEGRKLGLHLRTVGMKTTLHDFTWRIAGARKGQ